MYSLMSADAVWLRVPNVGCRVRLIPFVSETNAAEYGRSFISFSAPNVDIISAAKFSSVRAYYEWLLSVNVICRHRDGGRLKSRKLLQWLRLLWWLQSGTFNPLWFRDVHCLPFCLFEGLRSRDASGSYCSEGPCCAGWVGRFASILVPLAQAMLAIYSSAFEDS